ncbi:hypothetical protein DKM44_03880 [Deinococcus irradiatisoli]|uniref:Uncharacterized protein n=1 Tax=Deinococcus irradiatisoli TaxID=2202254 RepID=A0A2Z3JBS0_9DEIO|nr:hypothetical protein [Deinococcus irradiatisoli]AWN22482.1 hypothetical protein DKM44_03880 [Deinococcus irradiatisoli]
MIWRIRLNYALGSIVSAGMLSWPNGRPSYVVLETIGGLDMPWWVWPVALLLGAILLLIARGRIWLTGAYILTAVLITAIAAGVVLSVGPTVQLGPAVAVVMGCIRQGINARSEVA